MATQGQKSDIVLHIRTATTSLLTIIDRIEMLDVSFNSLQLDVTGQTPLSEADMVGNEGLTPQQIFDAIYALRLVHGYVNGTIDRATLEKIRTGW